MNLKIAHQLEASKIQNIFQQIVNETKTINPAFMNWSDQAIEDAVKLYRFIFLIDESDQPLAMICFQQNPDFVEILALGVLQKYRRLGISERLLRGFAKDCSTTSKLITLEVHSKNDRAIGLYTKCGFKTVRIRRNYYSDGSDALIMDFDQTSS